MKAHNFLYIIIAMFMLVTANSVSAEKGEGEILLDGFKFNDIAIDGNYVWCATNNDGVLRYNKIDGSYIQYTTQNGLPENIIKNNLILSVIIDKKGIKWIGASLGIASFNDTTWTAYGPSNINDWIGFDNAVVDHNNIKWFTAYEGIVAYNDTIFSFFKEYQYESDLIYRP